MPSQSSEPAVYKLAAVLYRPADDVDALLSAFAWDVARSGARIGGVVQRNIAAGGDEVPRMQLIDVMTARAISISQPRGRAAGGCRLDPAGLAEAAGAVSRAIDAGVALLVVNKFSKQEAAGQGLRSEVALAVEAGVPVLTAVPEKCFEAWTAFTDDRSVTLPCLRSAIDMWWCAVSARAA